MNASFGIDHPLIATHDITGLRKRLITLGFNMTAIGKHPWGTSTSLAMFEGCLIEIMGIDDETLLDAVPAGDFRFGRHVFDHLCRREGVALSALHSTDSVRDAARAKAAGFPVAGHLEFGRDVILPDGRAGRTRTTLAILPDSRWPRLSFFLCQQHRPDLIYVPEWLQHPNTANGICGVTILADRSDHAALEKKLGGIYAGFQEIEDGFSAQSANGPIRVQARAAIEAELGDLSSEIIPEDGPCIVAMDLRCANMGIVERTLSDSGLRVLESPDGPVLNDPLKTANMILRFTHGTQN